MPATVGIATPYTGSSGTCSQTTMRYLLQCRAATDMVQWVACLPVVGCTLEQGFQGTILAACARNIVSCCKVPVSRLIHPSGHSLTREVVRFEEGVLDQHVSSAIGNDVVVKVLGLLVRSPRALTLLHACCMLTAHACVRSGSWNIFWSEKKVSGR